MTEIISFIITLLTFIIVAYYFYQIKSVNISGGFETQIDHIYDTYVSSVFLVNNRNNTVLIYSINLVFNKDIVLTIYDKDFSIEPYSRMTVDIEPYHSLYIGHDEIKLEHESLYSSDTKLMFTTNFGDIFCSNGQGKEKYNFNRVSINRVKVNGNILSKNIMMITYIRHSLLIMDLLATNGIMAVFLFKVEI